MLQELSVVEQRYLAVREGRWAVLVELSVMEQRSYR